MFVVACCVGTCSTHNTRLARPHMDGREEEREGKAMFFLLCVMCFCVYASTINNCGNPHSVISGFAQQTSETDTGGVVVVVVGNKTMSKTKLHWKYERLTDGPCFVHASTKRKHKGKIKTSHKHIMRL